MNNLLITGVPRAKILQQITRAYPNWQRPENLVRQLVGPRNKREVQLEQGATIAYLASQYNRSDARILEIGACQGYTAGILALAAPLAQVTTLEPHKGRAEAVFHAVGQLGISVCDEKSEDYLMFANEQGLSFDLIFVDGDHANVAHDLPFYNLLRPDGLFLHHDYSPQGSARECIPVFDALNHFGRQLNHWPDVLVQDDTLVALAGWYKRDGEVWPPDGLEIGDDGYVVETERPVGQQPHAFDSEKGVICRHCLKTDKGGDHGIEPVGFLPDDDVAPVVEAPKRGESASHIPAETTAKPKTRRSRRSQKTGSSDD